MDKHLIGAFLKAAWRRRQLLLWPLAILLPITLVYAWAMPRQYQATALIMIPESVGLGGAQGGYGYSQDLAAKMKGLDALIKSDVILTDVISRDPGLTENPGSVSDRIDDLRRRISTRPVSDNMIQVALNGGTRQGLGDKLNAVLAGLFEGLLAPGQSANDAVSFVARQRQAEIDAIERRIKEVEAREPKLTEAMVREHVMAGNTAEDRIAAKQRLLDSDRARLQREIDSILAGTTAQRTESSAPIETLLEQIIAERRKQLEALTQKGDENSDAARQLRSSISRLSALSAQQKDAADLANEIKVERERVTSVQALARNLASLMQQRKALYEEVDRARGRHRQLMERLRTSGGAAALNLLRAPAQIQIVDPPADPTRPLNSRVRVLLIGIAAALAMSLGLATVAEQLDPTLRSRRQLMAVTDVPVLAQFTTWPSDQSPEGDDATTKQRWRPPLHPVDTNPDTAARRQMRS